MEPLRYGLLTVWLDKTFATDKETFQEIKKLLGLADPLIDETLNVSLYDRGALTKPELYGAPKDSTLYVVGVELNTLRRLASEKPSKPNIAGWFHAMAYTSDRRPDFGTAPRPAKKQTPQGPKP
jgi:hypothetical protein